MIKFKTQNIFVVFSTFLVLSFVTGCQLQNNISKNRTTNNEIRGENKTVDNVLENDLKYKDDKKQCDDADFDCPDFLLDSHYSEPSYRTYTGSKYDSFCDCVYWSKKLVDDLDFATVEFIDEKYAKDKINVYYEGKIIDGADPKTFEVKEEFIAIDNKRIYCGSVPCYYNVGKKIRDNYHIYDNKVYNGSLLVANDSESFVFYGYGYTSYDGAVYHFNKELMKADPATFKVFGYYAKDASRVWGGGVLVEGVDAESFVILNENTIKDKEAVYCRIGHENHVLLEDLDPEKTFIVDAFLTDGENFYCPRAKKLENVDSGSLVKLSCDYSKDKNNIYKNCSLYDLDTDIETFSVYPDCAHMKDKNNVYFKGELIKGADPETFVILNHGYKKDKNHVYTGISVVEGLDPNTFTVK